MDACAILQAYSRLVIDCNRPLDSPGSIVERSDGTPVPGNLDLDAHQRAQRIAEIFEPYHARIAAELDRRASAGRPVVLVAMHSFTPSMAGNDRPWHAGVLYQRDARFAHALLEALRDEGDLVVGDNEPYRVSDATDYAIPVHAERRGLPHVELEIRQDLIADEAGQQAWAQRLARLFTALQARYTARRKAPRLRARRRPRTTGAFAAALRPVTRRRRSRTSASTFSASNASGRTPA